MTCRDKGTRTHTTHKNGSSQSILHEGKKCTDKSTLSAAESSLPECLHGLKADCFTNNLAYLLSQSSSQPWINSLCFGRLYWNVHYARVKSCSVCCGVLLLYPMMPRLHATGFCRTCGACFSRDSEAWNHHSLPFSVSSLIYEENSLNTAVCILMASNGATILSIYIYVYNFFSSPLVVTEQ